jgi:hypothetical protein
MALLSSDGERGGAILLGQIGVGLALQQQQLGNLRMALLSSDEERGKTVLLGMVGVDSLLQYSSCLQPPQRLVSSRARQPTHADMDGAGWRLATRG